jgi:integrase
MAKHRETGHMTERSPGRWAIVISVKDAATGKRKRQRHSFAGTKREAQVERTRLLAAINAGTAIDPNKLTVASFFERWIEHMQGQVSPRTLERYAEIARNNLVPLLGGTALTKLQAAHISGAYAKALASGNRQTGRGLSARTVNHLHRVLREALQQAVRWQLLPRNPADIVKPPRIERKQMTVLNAGGTAALIEAARGYSMFAPVLLAVMTGMRRGEICALRWRNVDLDAGKLAVVASVEQTKAGCREKETKTGRGRVIDMPATLVVELRKHRIEQARKLLQLGIRLGPEHHVIMRPDGQGLTPNGLTASYWAFLNARGLRRVRLHDLRHTHATHLLAAGIHPKVASERLGHSKVGITLDLYSHVLPGMQSEAAAKIDTLITGALEQHKNARG